MAIGHDSEYGAVCHDIESLGTVRGMHALTGSFQQPSLALGRTFHAGGESVSVNERNDVAVKSNGSKSHSGEEQWKQKGTTVRLSPKPQP